MSRRSAARTTRIVVGTVALVLGLAGPALAGPPLLCHPFDIGGAASLPWDGSRAYWQGRADYSLGALVGDTERLLAPEAPIIVRMETLRRAAIYASASAEVAGRLYARLEARARQTVGGGAESALAIFDLGYLTETYRQIAALDRHESEFRGRGPALLRAVGGTNGYALVKKSLALRGDDPAMEFAAALAQDRRDEASYRAHVRKARAGAPRDPLLARNLDHLS